MDVNEEVNHTGSNPVLTTNIGGEAINKTHAEYSRLYLHETFPEKKVQTKLQKCLTRMDQFIIFI